MQAHPIFDVGSLGYQLMADRMSDKWECCDLLLECMAYCREI